MCLAVGVRSANSVFVTVIVHFQVVGHLFTAFVITQHRYVRWVMKLKEFHAPDFTATGFAAQAVQITLRQLQPRSERVMCSACTDNELHDWLVWARENGSSFLRAIDLH